jgi:hypothetical protein
MTMMELTDHHNIPLFNSAMRLLNNVFMQRCRLVSRFREVLTVCQGDFFKISLKIKEIRRKLIALGGYSPDDLCEEKQRDLPYPLWKPYDTSVKNEIDRTGIIQDLGYLALIFKLDVNIKNVEGLMSYYSYDKLGRVTALPVFN